MRQSFLLYAAFGLMAIIAILNYIALLLSLYWAYWWFDIIMHFLAGFAGGVFILWFFTPFRVYKSLFLTLGCLLVVGVAREIFEYMFDTAQAINYWQDTVYDLVNDVLGAFLAYVIVYLSVQTPKFSEK